MDFAKKILNKYGWKEGDGLGKNSSGISKPIKANLKFDTSGFGANQANSDFSNNWWERVYNEAAQNVTVQEKDNNVQIALKNANDTVEITTKGYSVKKLKKFKEKNITSGKYEGFLQTSMLNSEKLGNHCIGANDIEVQKFKLLSDEDLFKACGGRTAHKGARHGLKLSGKLARLENQEQEILAKMQQKDSSSDKTLIPDQGAELVDKVEKIKKRKRKQNDNKSKEKPSSTPEHATQFNKNSNGPNAGEEELSSKYHKMEVEYQKNLGGNELCDKSDASTKKLGSQKEVSPMCNSHLSKPPKKKQKRKEKTC